MLIEDFLNHYIEEVHNKKIERRKETFCEKVINIALIATIAIALSIICYYDYKGSIIKSLMVSVIFIAVEFVLIAISKKLYDKAWEERKRKYDQRLDKLKEVLNDQGYNTEKHVDAIIAWCEEYKKSESFWISTLKPIGAFFAVCIVPIFSQLLKDMYSDESTDKILIIIFAVLIGVIYTTIVYSVIPSVQNVLNKKQKLAKLMRDDLIQLKFREF